MNDILDIFEQAVTDAQNNLAENLAENKRMAVYEAAMATAKAAYFRACADREDAVAAEWLSILRDEETPCASQS